MFFGDGLCCINKPQSGPYPGVSELCYGILFLFKVGMLACWLHLVNICSVYVVYICVCMCVLSISKYGLVRE